MSQYRENFINTILQHSDSDEWESAVGEWEIEDCIEDEELKSSCICGKENLRYLFTIHNIHNHNVLEPIGSSCIKKFGRSDLNEQVSVNEKLFQLMHAIEEGEYISLTSEYFSRSLLRFMLEDGAFIETEFNRYNGENDYDFMLKMFNKRTAPTYKQDAKIKAIIMNSIRPYLMDKLDGKNIYNV